MRHCFFMALGYPPGDELLLRFGNQQKSLQFDLAIDLGELIRRLENYSSYYPKMNFNRSHFQLKWFFNRNEPISLFRPLSHFLKTIKWPKAIDSNVLSHPSKVGHVSNSNLFFLQEKRNIGRHHHCDFYEEESRGYFRFQSADDAKRYMSFFKRSGKPYQENQLRPKKVCSEFVKAHLQPVYNTGPGYSIFNVMPHHHRPVATTTAAPPPTTRLTTTTPTTLRPTIPTHKLRHQHHHQQQQQKKKKEQSSSELATQEFSSGQETRHIRHHQKQQAATQAKRKNPKKRPGHKRAGQGAGGGGGGGGGVALSRARGGGRKAVQQAPPPKQRDNPEILYLDEEELRQERIRALALEEEKARQRKEQRLAEFAMVDDYWNDDNMILSEEGPVWEVMRPEQKRASRQPAAARTGGGKGKPQDSILLNRLSEKRRGSSSSSSSEFKTQPGDRRTKTMPLKRLFAAPSKGNSSGSSSNTSNYRSMNSKKIASNPHDRLNNHHHHPNAKSRES